jgi:hypothetical protein
METSDMIKLPISFDKSELFMEKMPAYTKLLTIWTLFIAISQRLSVK